MTDRPSRRSWLIVAPLAVVIVLAIGWSAFWYFAARTADAAMAAWIEREAAVGRVYTCGSRSIGGYPFRIEARCTAPTVELRGGGAPATIRAQEILAVSQIYTPGLVVAEVTGPMTVTDAAGAPPLRATWSLLQVSFRGRPEAPERISLVVQAPALERADSNPPPPVARAATLEFHVRRNPASPADSPAYDLALSTTQADIAAIPVLAGKPLAADAAAVLRGLNDLAPKPLPERLRQWQAAGGRLEIVSAKATQGDAVAIAKGEVGLSQSGRPDGAVTLTVAGFEEFMRLIGLPALSGRGAGLLAGLAILGGASTEVDGKRAMAIPLRLQDGRILFGRVPLGSIGPFY